MPRGDGTGPDGRSGCLTNGLPFGYFRNNRGTGVGRMYGRGGGFGRGMGFRGGRGFYNPDVAPYQQPTKEEIQNYKSVLEKQIAIMQQELQGLEKRIKESEE